jgi:N-acetylneuraminic acid mutarotase
MTFGTWTTLRGTNFPYPGQDYCNFSSIYYKEKIFVFGGFISLPQTGEVISRKHIHMNQYDTILNKWSQITDAHGRIPAETHSHAAVVWKDEMFLVGGILDEQCSDEIYKFDLITHKWSFVKKSKHFALFGQSVVAWKGCLYIFGGADYKESPNNCMVKYDI